MQIILFIRFSIRKYLECSIRFCCVKILIVEVNNKVKTIVNYKIV